MYTPLSQPFISNHFILRLSLFSHCLVYPFAPTEQHGDNEEIAAILAKTQLSEGKTSEKKEDNETPLKSPFKRRSTIDTHPKG